MSELQLPATGPRVNDWVLETPAYSLPTEPERNMVRLHMNENRYGPAPDCLTLDCKTGDDHSVFEYPYHRNRVLSERLEAFLGISQEHLTINHGSAALIQQIFHCSIKSGDLVRIASHSWAYYPTLVNLCGARVEFFALDEETDRFTFDEGGLISTRTRPQLIVLNTPHMPTGAIASKKLVRKLLEDHPQALVLLDEAYWGFVEKPSSEEFAELVLEFPNLIITRTFSKLFALAGERIGYGIGSPALIESLRKWEPLFGIHAASQRRAVRALDNVEYYSHLRSTIRKQTDRLASALDPDKFTLMKSGGNYVLVRCTGVDAALVEEHLKQSKLVVRACQHYGLPNFVRVTIGLSHEIDSLISIMKEL